MELERAHQIARERGPVTARLLGRARDPAALLPRLLPVAAHGPRAHAEGRPRAARGKPPQLLGPVPDRLLPRAPAALRREDRAVRQALEGLDPPRARRLPDPAGRVRRGGDGDGPHHPRAGRRGRHLPRGHARAPRAAGRAQARRRPPRARDRRPDRPGRDHRHRGHPPRLAHPPPPCDRPLRSRAALPPPARPRAPSGRRAGDLQPRVVMHLAPVGVARRPSADPPCRGGRSRQLGHRGRHPACALGRHGAARMPHGRTGPRGRPQPHERPPTCPASTSRTACRS